MQQPPTCRNCQVPMEAGFQLDYRYSHIGQTRWVPGDPAKPGFFSISTNEATSEQRDNAYRITTFRCPKCGLLDSYAITPDPRA